MHCSTNLPVLQELQQQRQHGFGCLPKCSLFACGRQTRYADEEGLQFALVKEGERPSAWLLEAGENAQPGLVSVLQLRGGVLAALVPGRAHEGVAVTDGT